MKSKAKRLSFTVFIASVFVLIIIFSQKSREVTAQSLEFCARTLVPTLFPFAVIGSLVGSGLCEFPYALTKLVSRIFGVDERGAVALIPGIFCGFPVGCGGALGLYERSLTDERSLIRICALSCTPSAAFVISGVGEGMFGDRELGMIIYLSLTLSVFLIGFMTRGNTVGANGYTEYFQINETPKISKALATAISKSALSMLTVSAFVVFFSQIAFFLEIFCTLVGLPDIINASIKAVLEVTLGCKAASELSGDIGVLIAVFACAWSGLSVHMQTLALSAHVQSVKMLKRIVTLRALIALIACVTAFVLLRIRNIL